MSAPRKACTIQLVEIQHGERLAITPEPTFASDRVTCLREAKGRGYRATTQVHPVRYDIRSNEVNPVRYLVSNGVKELSPEINHRVGGRFSNDPGD